MGSRHRSGYDPDDHYVEDIQYHLGGISGVGLPFDLNEEEAARRYNELLEHEKRRRPPGFAAWPEDDEQTSSHLRIA